MIHCCFHIIFSQLSMLITEETQIFKFISVINAAAAAASSHNVFFLQQKFSRCLMMINNEKTSKVVKSKRKMGNTKINQLGG